MIHRFRFQQKFHTLSFVMAALAGLLLAEIASHGALAEDVGVAPATKKNADSKAAEEEIPEPEDVSLECKDGLELKATYYPGTKGKKTVPVVIIHDFDGNRSEYHPLALTLQAAGHAVIVPDLRGHGDSTSFKLEPGQNKIREVKAKSMKLTDFGMILGTSGDLQAVRRFLLDKNNAGELNINKLCVIGVGMGATIGLNWTAADWAYPPLAGKKQGQDVHALVLVSPTWGFKGMKIDAALLQPSIQKEVSLLVLSGATSKGKKEADRILRSLEKHRPEPPKEEIRDKKTLFSPEVKAALDGAKLLNEKNLKLDKPLLTFIEWRLVDQDYPWTER